VALIWLRMGRTLILGLDAEHVVLLVLTLFIAALTLATGRTTVLQGGIRLVIFAAVLAPAALPRAGRPVRRAHPGPPHVRTPPHRGTGSARRSIGRACSCGPRPGRSQPGRPRGGMQCRAPPAAA
jgi:hypothetical protein